MRAVSFVSDTGPTAARLPLVKPCSRCSITTVDPATGERDGGGETLRVLQDFRAGGRLRRSARLHKAYYSAAKRAKEAYFGQNALVELSGSAVLSVGDCGKAEW